ncbi:glucose PTS transporter subunit IIA [Propionibacterium australiense]|uniref:PTS beta-glucoside transporter subunit EIIBCA n=1 Tax=Propionibacterium australiense TaxID=119981 RepID=A0A383S5S9_9ACTN|nr:glucose PTS transporter subunit IIA [Propionibacterium australiense]RLP08171.1 PTS beta-glucoside transporter subunit EIIBCA [Propionibacterium australiense]RLP08301.1 PTS beta-glucoside transporter subunit EIIBCA [Propionibacterium australiense]SYZ33081.1 protein-Npi-phosphohistidine-sugar phosphotransferase [Propionibacterium australiense]VEH89082.1 EIIBCA-Bgl [Propionibacterium australiense]
MAQESTAPTTSDASAIVDALGGPDNITSLTHCATRLRFQLRDGSGVDKDTVEKIPVVMGAVPQTGNRYQVVIGGAVATVYNEIMALPQMATMGSGSKKPSDAEVKAAARQGGVRGRFSWVDTFFEFLSDSFRPIIGVLLGASLFITFMALMSTLGVIGNWSSGEAELPPSWAFINLCWRCVFYFLPLSVAYNATKKVGADPWIGFSVMAVLLLPGFMTADNSLLSDSHVTHVLGQDINIVQAFGLPLTIFDYGQQVFPPLLMAGLLGPLYKLTKRIIPDNLQLIFVPFLCMLIMIPLTAFVLGPIGVYAGAGLSTALKAVNDLSPFIFCLLIPLLYPFMVPLGLHWPINAVMLLNIQAIGYDYIQGPMGAWNFACFGASAAVLAISIREKDVEMRQTATGAVVAGLVGGISEPSLYGIHLRFRRIYPRMLIGCVVGGLIQGIGGGVTTNAFVFTSLLTIPAFSNIPLYALSVLAAFAVAFVAIYFSDYRTPEQRAESRERIAQQRAEHETREIAREARKTEHKAEKSATAPAPAKTALAPNAVTKVASPLAGRVIPLEEVPDPVFSAGTVGKGVGIEPVGTTVVAPGDGTIVVAQATGHAFGVKLDNGIELLIHVGIDTVNLEGRGFDVKVAKGDRVAAGDPLVTFDPEVITEAGYSLVTPVLVTNVRRFAEITRIAEGEVNPGDAIIETTAKPPKEPKPAAE